MGDEFTAEEKAYVESRGEQGPQVEETTQEPIAVEKAAEAVVEKPAEQPVQEEQRVPVAAVQEERRRRKEAEKREADMRAQFERLQGRVEGLQERQPPQQQEQVEEDPLARLERLEREAVQNRQMQHIQATHAELGNRFDASVNAFKAEQADVTQGIEFLVRSRERELTEVHGVDPARVKGMLGNEMFQFLQNCAARGVDPARAAYQWAKERGYQAAPPVSRETIDPAAAAQADLARITAGQAAAKSLGQATGAPGGHLTAEAFTDLPLNEFTKALNGMTRDQLKQMLGG